MKTFVADKYEKKGALRLADMPKPELQDNDVLVEVHAAGVNLLDSKLRDGEFKLIVPYRPPFVLGHDVAGIVVRAGSKVRKFKAGDEVYARPRDGRIGTFAEFIAMDEADVALKPKNLSMEEAASIPLVGLTAWQVLVERAGLTSWHPGCSRRRHSPAGPSRNRPSDSRRRHRRPCFLANPGSGGPEMDISLPPGFSTRSDFSSAAGPNAPVWTIPSCSCGRLNVVLKLVLRLLSLGIPGSGGVGTFAIQLAKHLGATVATTASAANMGLVKSLGLPAASI
nr:NADP-dependent oxidoreductase [Mesorhizobium sp. WSM3626]